MTRLVRVALLVVLLAGCDATDATPAPASSGQPIGAQRLEVAPATVLLNAQGDTRTLAATVVGTGGGGAVTWQSSNPAVAEVSGAGVVTAKAFGSAQVTAAAGELRSAPVLVVVARLGEGVDPVADEVILSDPVDTDPTGEPAADATYDVILGGTAPAVGDRLVGTGGKALAGEVAATAPAPNGTRVTMRLVPLGELLPGFEMAEVMDLSHAPVAVPAEVAELFDVTRAGNRFDFAPKANFQDLVGSRRGGARLAAFNGEPVGTSADPVPPFHECKGSLPSLPVGLPRPPRFSIAIEPTLDVAWSADELQRFVVRATPTASIELALAIEAAFEASYECKRELFVFQLPIAGALSFFISGLVPVGVGFEVSGKFTLATVGISTKASVGTTVAFGLDCSAGSCEGVGDLGQLQTTEFQPKVDVQNPGDVRFEPAFKVFAYAKAEVGNRYLRRLRFEAISVKAGGKLAADFAPLSVQIEDPSYASKFKLSLEAGASVGPRVGELAEMLGLDSISFAGVEASTDLETSPTGSMVADRSSYQTGDVVGVHVTLAEEGLLLLDLLYDVERVLLVRDSGGRAEVVATQDANDGQREFDLSFEAPGPVDASELHAFVVAAVAPFDIFAMELAAAAPQPTGTPKPTAPPAAGGWHGTLSIQGAAPIEFDVDLVEDSTPSETRARGDIEFDDFTIPPIPYVNATGTITLRILRDGRVQLQLLEIRNGPGMPQCTLGFEGIGEIDAAGEVIDVPVQGTGSCGGSATGTLRLERN